MDNIYTIKINFKPIASEETSIEFPIFSDKELKDTNICEALFSQSNIGEGELYNRIQANHFVKYGRMARSLSVFDEVTIQDRTYKCAAFGWEKVGA